MEENDYTSGLNMLLGNLSRTPKNPQSPEQEIKQLYDEPMSKEAQVPQGLESLIEGSVQTTTADDVAYDQYLRGQAAGDMGQEMYAGLDRYAQGPMPDQQVTNPLQMVGDANYRFRTSLAAGYGNLLVGTGDTVDFVSALVSPGEGDLSTSVGDYLRKVGTEYQQENTLILGDRLKDITWRDMLNGEFWSSKVARQIPYTMSFMIPYTAGARGATFLLGRIGPAALKWAGKSRVLGKLNKGVKLKGAGTKAYKGKKGTGILQYLGTDAGKLGITPTKFLRDVTGYLGGGGLANLSEGAYLSGEAYSELANEKDPLTGEPLFTPSEAAEHAAGVMKDNVKWMGVDILQYGILFGGAGKGVIKRLTNTRPQKTPFTPSITGLTNWATRKAKDVGGALGVAGIYGTAEGVTEGIQEVYQEWAKYKAISEAKGEEYEPMSEWIKNAPFGEDRPELRDIFWSAFALGIGMGGARGYYDAAAERKSLTDKKIDQYNNTIDFISESMESGSVDQQMAFEMAFDNLIASNLWNYSGDGSAAMSIVDNLVKDGKLTEEQALEYKTKIELAEKMYEKHHINTSLTEAGAEQAFYNEMRKSRQEGAIADEMQRHADAVAHEKTVIKDKQKLDAKLKIMEEEHQQTLNQLNAELAATNQAIEDIYTAELDKNYATEAKPEDKQVGSVKKGLTRDEFETFTQEGEKQRTEREKAEAEAKAAEEAAKPQTSIIDKVTDLGTKAVEGVRGLFNRKKETKEETKTDTSFVDELNATSTAKSELKKAIDTNILSEEQVRQIKGTGRGGTINNKDVESALRKSGKLLGDVKKKDQTKVTEEVYKEFVDKGTVSQDVLDSIANKIKNNENLTVEEESIRQAKSKEVESLLRDDRVVPKTKEYESIEASLEKGPRQIKKADIQKGKGPNYFIKTPEGETIQYRDFDNISDKYVLDEDANVELRLKKPVKGQEGVVEVGGKLYFQFDNNLYETEIQVVINDEVVGKVAQRDYKKQKLPESIKAETILNKIVSSGHFLAPIAKMLLRNVKIKENKIKIIYKGRVPGTSDFLGPFLLGGIYINPVEIKKLAKDSGISLEDATYEVVVHEEIHRITRTLIASDKIGSTDFFSKEDKQFVSEVKDLYAQYLKSDITSQFPRVDSLDEFITYGLTNPEFSQALSKIKVENTTVLDRLINSIMTLLGVKNVNIRQALEKSFDNYSKFNFETIAKSVMTVEEFKSKEPTKKAKKKDTRKIDKIVGSIKEAKEDIKKFFTKGEKEIPNYEPTTFDIRPLYRYGSGVMASSIVRDIVNKRFPGAKGIVTYTKLIDDYGQEASSLAIGSTVFINIDSVGQSDIIHEAGHIYYGIMENTPLMKKIRKLLPKTDLYQRTKQEYPELILMSYKGDKATLGLIYRNILNNTDMENYDSDIISIVKNIAAAEKAGETARINELFLSLRTQLKLQGFKDVRASQQRHILEETFVRTLEAYSAGSPNSVIKGTAAQKQLEEDLIKFYKEVKNLSTDEEAREILDLTVEGIATLDLENAIKAVLLNFNSKDRTIPKMKNSAYGVIKKAKKKQFVKTTSYAAVSSYIGDFIDRNLTPEEIADRVMESIANDSNLSIEDELVQSTREHIKAIITQLKRPQTLKQADKILDAELAKIGIKIDVEDSVEGESESMTNEVDKHDDTIKAIALPTTTSNFIKKIVEVYNSKQEEGGLINTKDLLSSLMSLAKDTQNDPYDFITELRKSTNPNITAMLSVLDRVYKNDQVLTNAKLMEIKGPIEGINMEVLAHNVLTIGDEGKRFWNRYEDTNSTIEKSVIDSVAKEIKGNKEKANAIAAVYNELFFDRNPRNKKDRYDAAYKVLDIILEDNAKGSLINKEALLQTPILFKGERQFVWNILFDFTQTKFGPKMKYQSFLKYKNKKVGFSDFVNFPVEGLIHGKQSELKTILLQGLVASRAINYLSIVDNVEGDGVSIMNKENGLHNRAKNVARIFNEEQPIDKNDIMHPDNNIYGQMAATNKNDRGISPFHFTVHSGMMRRIINKAVGLKNKENRSKKLTGLNPNELIAGDFFMFLNRYNQGIKNKLKTIIYDQPIAVFSDKSRRYYVESIVAHDAASRKALLSKVKNNPAYKAKYKDGSRVFPYTIEKNKIKEMPKLIRQWREYANANKELFKNNEAIKKGVLQDGAIEAFLTSYIANKFMAQQLFVHDHRQSKNQVDYIKRAAGAIASHVVFDRNTSVEFVVTKDYYVDKEGNIGTEDNANTAIENDAMGYVLPEQAEYIRAKYGEAQKVGNVFKFVYHYTQLEGPLKGRTTYMKFAVHTLTPELEAKSPYLKNIGEILRKRQEEVRVQSGTPGNLVIAASESAAKLYTGGDAVVHDVSTLDNIENIMAEQDKIYTDETGYVGLSGEGFGIQLELDKQTDERFFPSQLFYNLATNITPEDQVTLNRMLELRQNVMEANNASRNASLIMNDKGTEESVIKERDSFRSSVTAEVFDVLIDSTYENLDPRYPYLNSIYNSIATGRITHKGTKMYTKGSIGYQSASLGMDLKSYEKGLYKEDETIVASEAIVPEYLKKQGVRIGDLFIGTRVPAHGKVSSSVFIVKDFHKQIGDSPTSNVTIPAWVSKYWGADLDGDSIHMNFKWTDTEVTEKSWRADSNEFFDLYTKLVSKDSKQAEIQADIDFVSDAENAIAKIPGTKETDSQLAPWGDAQMFEDNVPAKNLVGMIASLMRSFSVFSNSRDALPFSITINGEQGAVTQDRFFDDASLENGVGNWYGVAQLLNISLDNAKHQYASKLGMDMQSVFPYVLLRRLGYSLNDLAVLFNSPIVKKYMEYKRNRSKDYISRDSDIKDMFIQKDSINENQLLKFAKENGLGNIDIKGFAKKPAININLKSLKNNKTAQKQAVLMLYALDRFKNAAVDPISKSFTIHQSIEKNPLELKQVLDGITNAQGVIRMPLIGSVGIDYSFTDKTKSNNIIEHATGLFESILQRAARTDVRYTPYMQSILTNPMAVERLNKLGEIKSEVINQVIVNNLRQEFSMLNTVRSEAELIRQLEILKELNPDNYFLNKIIEVSERNNKKYVVLNRAEITEFTSYKAVEQIKDSFSELSETDKNLIFEIEYAFNSFGLAGAGKATSFIPFFDNAYLERINSEMSRIIEKNQNRQGNYETGSTSVELEDAIKDVQRRRSGRESYTTNEKISIAARDNNTFEAPVRKAKKIITPETSYNNDHLGGGVEFLSFEDWANDKGIDISKIDIESDTFKSLSENYAKYRDHLKLVREFEGSLEEKPLSKYTIEGLYDMARKFRKMDNSATKGIAYTIEKEIGQRAFKIQSEFLRKKGAQQGYKYNVPGEDGVEQEDLTNFQAWLGSNNMTSKRPEIQYLINEAQTQYRKYIKSFKEHKRLIEEKNRALERSKMKGLSVLERIRQEFDRNAKYQYIYGNIATVENGNVRLYTPEEIVQNGVELTKEEEEYYIRYKAVAELLLGTEQDVTIVPGMQMGNLENLSRSGLFGLYNSTIDSYDYNRVKVYGTDKDGKRALRPFYEWKYIVYKGRTGKLTLDSGRQIFELDKLRRKAKQLKQKNKNEDGSNIILSDMEYDALVNNGEMMRRLIGSDNVNSFDAELIQEYERRKGVRAEGASYDINSALLEFARGHIFMHGEGSYKLEDGTLVEREDRFTGMGDLAILTDSIIAFNKNLDNKNATRYVTEWWKEGFLEKKKQVGVFGETGDKVIDGFVKLTSLRLLGFNLTVGIGNTLAGKYQELRKRGGKQFIKGETRYWKDMMRSRDILREYRVIDYSFDEFVHLSKQKTFGKIERYAYMFMDKTEGYIQGAAFLGMLTDQEYNSGKISEQRVMEINHKISTLHGEGYTALDASLLSMYSYGRALLQFKKWFVTLFQDRFKAEDIDRFGNVNIGSYRASSEFVTDLFRRYFAGDITKQEIIEMFNNASEARKTEMRAHATGIGIGVTLLSLIAMMDDDDEADSNTLKNLKKLSHDIFVTTDARRFVNYTIMPASYGTSKNAVKAIGEAVSGEKTQRKSEYAKKGESQAFKTLMNEVAPFAETRKQLINFTE